MSGGKLVKKPTLRMTFAKNVRLYRIKLGWSQERLADECQLDRTFIGTLERGTRNVSIDNVDRISNALQLPPIELLDPEMAKRMGLDETIRRAARASRH